jgi:hypothetical protein
VVIPVRRAAKKTKRVAGIGGVLLTTERTEEERKRGGGAAFLGWAGSVGREGTTDFTDFTDFWFDGSATNFRKLFDVTEIIKSLSFISGSQCFSGSPVSFI